MKSLRFTRALLIFLVTLASVAWASRAAAASCTINGSMTIQPKDQYYCDTTILGSACTGWKEVDLDTKTVGVPYMYIEVTSTSFDFKYTSSDINGNWSVTLTNVPNCNVQGAVTVNVWFAGP